MRLDTINPTAGARGKSGIYAHEALSLYSRFVFATNHWNRRQVVYNAVEEHLPDLQAEKERVLDYFRWREAR